MRAKLTIAVSVLAITCVLSACSPPAPDSTDASVSGTAMAPDSGAKTGSSVGMITAIDAAAGTVTIQHQAIPAVGWPAMTMPFKASPSTLLDGLKVGDKVKFDVKLQGSDAEVTAVTPQ